jgi:hypothetical protein
VWIKGKDNTKADFLSRIPYRKAGTDDIIDIEDDSVSASMIATVNLFKGSHFDYTATPLRDERLLELRAHQDENYEKLKTTIIKDGWPEIRIDLHPDLETFWSHRESLSIDNDGFIIKNGRLLVPAGLRQINLVAIHHKRHQEHCENLSTLSREATEPGTRARTYPRGSILSIPLPAHGPRELLRKTVLDSYLPIFKFPTHLRVRKTSNDKASHGLHHAVHYYVQRAGRYLQRRRSTIQRRV